MPIARPRVHALAALAALAVMAAVLAAIPMHTQWSPRCPSYAWFGVTCPGCGSTRATHALMRGDVRAAWAFNPFFLLVGVPVFAFILLDSLVMLVSAQPLWRPKRVPAWLGWVIAAGLVAYTIARTV